MFTEAELRQTLQKMKNGKATKPDDIPAEAFKALSQAPGQLQWMLDFCNDCWGHKSLPDDWLVAMVSLIYKKGDPASCDNYRPICLLSIGLKAFAAMLKQRLVDAGAEDRLWPSQFGFRSSCSTEDAIYIARRRIELARAQRNGSVVLVALDWKKAFDSINLLSLRDALRRIGMPIEVLDMVDGMMRPRKFVVSECGSESTPQPQKSGISQGCTLSPLLFVLVMTVLLHDAFSNLSDAAKNAHAQGDLAECVFADDTVCPNNT